MNSRIQKPNCPRCPAHEPGSAGTLAGVLPVESFAGKGADARSQKHRRLLRVPLNVRVLVFACLVTGPFAFGQGFATNTYTVSSEDFANPERGFYFQADSYASAPSSVPANLASYRINGRNSPGNTYTAKISLLLRLFYLNTFVNAPISSNYLDSIQTDFNSIRAQGSKAIVRFAYNRDQTRPFAEPSKARVLAHI